jgi:hypothetical protein
MQRPVRVHAQALHWLTREWPLARADPGHLVVAVSRVKVLLGGLKPEQVWELVFRVCVELAELVQVFFVLWLLGLTVPEPCQCTL